MCASFCETSRDPICYSHRFKCGYNCFCKPGYIKRINKRCIPSAACWSYLVRNTWCVFCFNFCDKKVLENLTVFHISNWAFMYQLSFLMQSFQQQVVVTLLRVMSWAAMRLWNANYPIETWIIDFSAMRPTQTASSAKYSHRVRTSTRALKWSWTIAF